MASLGICGVELLCHRICMYLALVSTAKQVPKVILPTYSPTSNISVPIALPVLGTFHLSNFIHPGGCVVISHGGFNFYFTGY